MKTQEATTTTKKATKTKATKAAGKPAPKAAAAKTAKATKAAKVPKDQPKAKGAVRAGSKTAIVLELHQMSWLIDAGTETETCFVGGINLNPHSMVAPDHRGEGQNHDVYIELAGPSEVDVHHSFVQRWNEASERHLSDGGGDPAVRSIYFFPPECLAQRATPEFRSRGRFMVAGTAMGERRLEAPLSI